MLAYRARNNIFAANNFNRFSRYANTDVTHVSGERLPRFPLSTPIVIEWRDTLKIKLNNDIES